ncbi:MAG: ihfB [Rickettsiaceae bacterium]|jgi:integration host factor subunit beta|nr:ihfB [Rickettsiaceae bacterium]
MAERFPNMFLKDIQILVDTIFDDISKALAEGNRVELRGFGAFTIRKRKARVARNPRTNDVVELGERSALYFRAGKELNARLNSN